MLDEMLTMAVEIVMPIAQASFLLETVENFKRLRALILFGCGNLTVALTSRTEIVKETALLRTVKLKFNGDLRHRIPMT